jgi:hypothetical protein
MARRCSAALPVVLLAFVISVLLPAVGQARGHLASECSPRPAHCSLAQRLASARAHRVLHPRARTHSARPAILGGTGAIEGTVTNAATKLGFEGIEVCAYERELLEEGVYEEEPGECVTVTESSGHYKIPELEGGEYLVEFWDPASSFITQFWKAAEIGQEPTFVTVEAEKTVKGINAAMVEGGRIEGTVKGQGAPLEGIQVCAEEFEIEIFVCTRSGPDGKYVIGALPAGFYELEFSVPRKPGFNYLGGWLDEEFEVQLKKTTAIGSVELPVAGEISGRVSAASTGAGLAGIEVRAIGSTLHAIEFSYTGAAGEYLLERLPTDSYRVEFFDLSSVYLPQFYSGKELKSEATLVPVVAGGKAAGGIDAVMHTVAPEPPPTPAKVVAPPVPVTVPVPSAGVLPAQSVVPSLAVLGRVHVAGRRATVSLRCGLAACRGPLQLTITVTRRVRAHGHTVTRRITLVVGSGSFSLASGATGKVTIQLTAQGRALLASAARHPRAGKLKLSPQGASSSLHAVTIN